VSGKSICTDPQVITGRTAAQCRDNVTFLMTKSLDPFRFLLIALSGWMNQQQLQFVDLWSAKTSAMGKLHEDWCDSSYSLPSRKISVQSFCHVRS
jgi:hypothetical protein